MKTRNGTIAMHEADQGAQCIHCEVRWRERDGQVESLQVPRIAVPPSKGSSFHGHVVSPGSRAPAWPAQRDLRFVSQTFARRGKGPFVCGLRCVRGRGRAGFRERARGKRHGKADEPRGALHDPCPAAAIFSPRHVSPTDRIRGERAPWQRHARRRGAVARAAHGVLPHPQAFGHARRAGDANARPPHRADRARARAARALPRGLRFVRAFRREA